MRPRVDLHLVANTIRGLNDSAYFDGRVREFTGHFLGAIEHVLESPGKYDAAIELEFAAQARAVQSYLSGSTNNEIPYEVVYCLGGALRVWGSPDAAVVTHLTEGHDFHLKPLDPWNFIENSISDYDAQGFQLPLVMIGVPRIYAHKPVFCIPLFHELGHFVDLRNSVSQVSMLINPPQNDFWQEYHHRMEYFADLFGASFVGRASVEALKTIAPNHAASPTHPATADRVAVVDTFLAGNSNPIIDMLQAALAARRLSPLVVSYKQVDVTQSFDGLKTFIPQEMGEVNGLLGDAWRYLFEKMDAGSNPWNVPQMSDGLLESVVNDLTEKSIRNYAVREAWNDATSKS